MRKKLPDIDTLLSLRLAGLSYREIGELYGVTGSSVWYAINVSQARAKWQWSADTLAPLELLEKWRNDGADPATVRQKNDEWIARKRREFVLSQEAK